MKGAECIIAVNSDRTASIFDVAHYCVIGDMYECLDELEKMIKEAGK
jgi:electron transfer flavoprotein alpha subunit